jgi:hypothetical protein
LESRALHDTLHQRCKTHILELGYTSDAAFDSALDPGTA